MSALATRVRLENGSWVGIDGPLHKDDPAALNRVHRQLIDEELSALTSQPLQKPQSYGDLLEAKEHLAAIRELKAVRDSLGDSDAG